MKINELYIRKFGKLKEYRLNLSDGTNVIFGANEAGKTTIFNFILAMLYGLSNSRGKDLSDNVRRKYITWGENKIGGTMTLEHNGVTYVIDRTFGKTKAGDSLELTNLTLGESVSLPSGKEVGEYLFDLDEKSFKGTCFIGQLAKDDVCNNDSIKTKLSNLSGTGDADYSFDDVFGRLKNASLEIIRKTSTGKIHPLEVRRGELEDRNRAVALELDRLNSIDSENNALENDIKALSASLSETEGAIIKANSYKRAERYKKALENNMRIDELRLAAQNSCEQITRKGFTADREYIDRLNLLIKKREDAETKFKNEEAILEAERKSADAPPPSKPEQKKASLVPFVVVSALLAVIAVVLCFVLESLVVPGVVFCAATIVFVCGCLVISNKNKSYIESEKAETLAQKARLDTIAERVKQLENECAICNDEFCEQFLLFFESDQLQNAQSSISNLSSMLDKCVEAKIRYDAAKSSEISQQALDEMREGIDDADLTICPQELDAEKLEADKRSMLNEISSKEKTLLVNKERARAKGKLQTELETNLAEITEINDKIKAYEYKKECLELAKQGLENAQAQLQMQFSPEVNRLVSDIIAQITDGKYKQMILNSELQTMVVDNESGAAHEDGFMSAGTLDQIYLALRFAMINLIFADRECPIICMDDALLNFDPTRMSKAAEYISTVLSQRAQVLFFTCRDTEKECFSGANQISI